MKSPVNIKQQVDVCLGRAGTHIGNLTYVKQGKRENTAFAYAPAWLANPDAFSVSPDLVLISGHQIRKAPLPSDACFHFAMADTAPDAWGRRVILREHAKRRKVDASLRELTELDFLLAVDDFSRIGALRLQDRAGTYLRTVEQGQRTTPAMLDLQHLFEASRAVETGTESADDLRYLVGKGTSLGGMRPKCAVIDDNGLLAIGKFPSVDDTRSVTRGEVLALHLARLAGIDAAPARIPYLSAASMLQASRQHEHSYTEIADAIRANSPQPKADARQLWRRIVFNLLITNVDDHLQNLGFLHVSNAQWRLAPAFDLNPFPDKDRESKTWLSADVGPVMELTPLIAHCAYFSLTPALALAALADVVKSVSDWRTVAVRCNAGLGLGI